MAPLSSYRLSSPSREQRSKHMNKNELSKNDPPKDNQPFEVGLYKLVEMGNGTISIFTILETLAEGHRFVRFKEFPEFVFDLESDYEKIEQLLDAYKKGGIKAGRVFLEQ